MTRDQVRGAPVGQAAGGGETQADVGLRQGKGDMGHVFRERARGQAVGCHHNQRHFRLMANHLPHGAERIHPQQRLFPQDGMKAFINSGKGFVCLHISTCLANTWPEYHDITGGGWISGTSFHPPYGEYTVNIKDGTHPGVQGISDFSTNDELYMGLAIKDGNNVFITGDAESGTHPWGPERKPQDMPGGTFPLGWTRKYGAGNVFVLLLGHDGRSFETPEFQKIVLNGVNWATQSA